MNELIQTVDEDGFVIIRDLFDPALVEQARREIDAVMDSASLDNRRYWYMTLHVDAPGKSRAFDQMLEQLLTNPLTMNLFHAIGGPQLKIKDINVRRMTGAKDRGLLWHRDDTYEFGFGIFLSDAKEGDVVTGMIPGSHKHQKKLIKEMVAPYGKQGDLYVFMNQTWHNRTPNRHGSKNMVALGSFFPQEAVFPTAERDHSKVTDGLPPNLTEHLSRTGTTLLYSMLRTRRELRRKPSSAEILVRKVYEKARSFI